MPSHYALIVTGKPIMVFWSYCQLTSKPKSYEVAESPHVVLPPMGIKACIVQNLRYATFDYPLQRINKMEKEDFKAHVQYDDWKGSVAADSADQEDFSDFLRDKGVLKEGEIVKGISFYSAEHFFDVEAFVSDDEHGLRREKVKMTLEEFFKTFKRFSVKISRNGELDDQDIEFEE